MNIKNINRLWLALATAVLTLSAPALTSCDDEIKDESSRFTFTGETITSYVEKYDEFSTFSTVLERAKLKSLLSAYGSYTCFVPTNGAMAEYLKQKFEDGDIQDSVAANLSEAEAKEIAYGHLISQTYLTTEFEVGAISTPNMNDRYIVVGFEANNTIVLNNTSTIVMKDEEVSNGVVQVIDHALNPSNAEIPDLIASNSDLSIFSAALDTTHLADSLRSIKDQSYEAKGDVWQHYESGSNLPDPNSRKYGYTVMIESNSVFEANGIRTLDDLVKEAQRLYPNAKGTKFTDRDNALNMFIAYHLVKKNINFNEFTTQQHVMTGFDRYEYYETLMPVSQNDGTCYTDENGKMITNAGNLFKVTVGANPSSNGPRINRCVRETTVNKTKTAKIVEGSDGKLLEGIKIVNPAESGVSQSALNGCYYYISDILAYTSDVVNKVLNERIRFDVASLFPELTNNSIRWKGDLYDGNYCDTYIPKGYCSGVLDQSDDSRFYYLYPRDSWHNYEGDEMMVCGQYDITLRLLPVPPGTYEVRFGYQSEGKRGVAQFYLDGTPQGIPVDLTIAGTNALVGWIADTGDEDSDAEEDKMMRNRGYMKGPNSAWVGSDGTSLRTASSTLRRIITTKTLTPGVHTIRFKNVLTTSKQLQIDYFELVPTSVINSEQGEDRH